MGFVISIKEDLSAKVVLYLFILSL